MVREWERGSEGEGRERRGGDVCGLYDVYQCDMRVVFIQRKRERGEGERRGEREREFIWNGTQTGGPSV
jgi:hypothetical protein